MAGAGGGAIILRHSLLQNIRGNAGWQIQNDSGYDVMASDADLDAWFANVNPSSSYTKLIPGF